MNVYLNLPSTKKHNLTVTLAQDSSLVICISKFIHLWILIRYKCMNLTLSTPPLPIHKQTIKNKNKIKNPTSLIKLADTIQIMEDADTNQIMEDARMF